MNQFNFFVIIPVYLMQFHHFLMDFLKKITSNLSFDDLHPYTIMAIFQFDYYLDKVFV
jgi:hypothetical protein